MEVIETVLLDKLIWVPWIAIGFVLMFLIRRLFVHDNTLKNHETEIALCRQRDEQRDVQRREDRQLRDRQHKELNARIDKHHGIVMSKLDTL